MPLEPADLEITQYGVFGSWPDSSGPWWRVIHIRHRPSGIGVEIFRAMLHAPADEAETARRDQRQLEGVLEIVLEDREHD